MSEETDGFGIPLMEMARVWTSDSGLSRAVVILVTDGSHGPRIKVSLLPGNKVDKDHLVSVSIDDDPKFLHPNNFSNEEKKQIIEFVRKNKDVLLDHYFGRISDKEALNSLQKV